MASIAFPNNSKSLTTSDGTHYGYINVPAHPGKPTLLFLHGYPSSSYHWLSQVSRCITSGYGAIAPDLLGYGDSSKPTSISAYDQTIISKHVTEILDTEKVTKVIGIGHDWGSSFLATFARTYPERFSHLVFMAVGYRATQEMMLDIDALNEQITKAMGRPTMGYWKFFNTADAAGIFDELEKNSPLSAASLMFPADPKTWITSLCTPGGVEAWASERKTTEIAPWVDPKELETHRQIMLAGGYTGPLNWYKQAMAGITHTSEKKLNPKYPETKFEVPTLFIGCEKDSICVPAIQQHGFQGLFGDLTYKIVEAGHWLMLEKPEETWEVLRGWIEEKGKAL